MSRDLEWRGRSDEVRGDEAAESKRGLREPLGWVGSELLGIV